MDRDASDPAGLGVSIVDRDAAAPGPAVPVGAWSRGSGAGPAPESPGLPLAWLVAPLVLIGAVVYGASHFGGQPSSLTPVDPAPSAPPSRPAQPHLAVGTLCPVVTDHRTTVTVSFTVVNTDPAPVSFVSAEPLLPLDGLRPLATSLTGGGCNGPATPVPDTLGGPDKNVLVTFRFGLPAECPSGYPVSATVFVRSGTIVNQQLLVLRDLRETAFDSC